MSVGDFKDIVVTSIPEAGKGVECIQCCAFCFLSERHKNIPELMNVTFCAIYK
jgi:hypothetical protein